MDSYQHWDECDECGFQGLIVFCCRADEDYADEEALGFVMDSTCPACGIELSVLMIIEQYREMLLLAQNKPSS